MNRRVLTAVLAAVLALATFVAMWQWGNNAEQRALASVKTTKVYTVVTRVAKGTLGNALGETVKLTELPAMSVPAGAVTNLSSIATKLTSADLLPGEVLLTARFVDKTAATSDAVEVPKGMEQVSILVKPEQVRGGVVAAGDHVAIIATVDATTGPGTSPSGVTVASKAVTQQILSHLLVTRVQGGAATTTSTSTGTTTTTVNKANTVPTGSVIVTVAVSVGDAEKVVWAINEAKVYLAVESADTDISTSNSATGRDVFNQ